MFQYIQWSKHTKKGLTLINVGYLWPENNKRGLRNQFLQQLISLLTDGVNNNLGSEEGGMGARKWEKKWGTGKRGRTHTSGL